MAFSTLLKSSVNMNRFLTQQVVKFTTQSSLQRPLLSIKPLSTLKQGPATPILNSIRSLRTSPVRFNVGAKSDDHSKIWLIERVVSLALVPLVPLAIMAPNKVFDSLVAILMVAHSFWGLEAIAVDYVRASIFGPVLPKVALGVVWLISIATLGGLFYIISHDIGLGNTVRQFWAIKSKNNS